MYRSSQLRNTGHTLLPQAQDQAQDHHHHLPSQQLPSSVSLMPPPSSSSSSLASSFSSSAHSSMLLPPGPAGATQSNVLAPSDHVLTHPTPRPVVAPVPSKNTNNKFFALNISPAPRSDSLAHMGQGGSRAASVPPSNPTTITPTTTNSSSSFSSSSNGGMFKRWQHGRRRKSEDANVVLSGDEGGLSQITKGTERELLDQSRATTATVSATSASSSAQSGAQVHPHNPPVPPPSKPSKHIFSSAQLSSTFSVFGSRNRHANSPTKSPKVSNSAPMPPPKPLELKGKKLPAAPVEKPIPTAAEPMPSRAAPSPLPSSSTTQLSPTPRPPREAPREEHSSPKEKPDFDIKQDWRKSDSTMTSHGTIRPGALGNRSPRPVSLAESSHSGHTVVPVNKRLSALLTDAEFVMPEEGDLADTDSEPTIIMGGSSGRPSVSSSPQSSLSKSRNRRSMSLGAPTYLQRSKASTPEPTHTPAYDASTSGSPINRTLTDTTSLSQSWSRDSPTITKASAKGFIAPTAAPGAAHNTGSNIRSRLAAWTSAANRSDRALSPPPVHPRRGLVPPPSPQPSFRQTAVSMTGGLAPAAGIAMGIGKRAAEKVHRVWGGFSSSSSSNSGYSSSSSAGTGTAPSSYNSSRHSDNILGRSASDLHSSLLGNVTAGGQTNSGAGPGWKARRRTPNAPSGSWSFASSTTSVSDVEGLTRPAGPSLGTLLRTPKRTRSGGSVAGGLVFGRDLQVCVQETAVDGVRNARKDGVVSSGAGGMRPLEERLVPALVVRCAQHLKMWGVQEEGLFRFVSSTSTSLVTISLLCFLLTEYV